MITLPQTTPPTPPEGVKETYDEIASRIQSTYDNVENLGVSSYSDKNLYGVWLGDLINKPVIFLNACIHGDEWESTYWTLHFFDCIVDPEKSLPALRGHFEYLRSNYSFYMLPIVNPYGFEHETRRGLNNVDYNRQYQNDRYNEVNAVKSKVRELKPVLFLDNHTSGYPNETIGVGGYGVDLTLIGDTLIKSLKYVRGHNAIKWYETAVSTNTETGRGWASNEMSSRGINILSVLIEGVYREDSRFNTYKDKTEFGFSTLLLSCLYIDLFLREHIHAK